MMQRLEGPPGQVTLPMAFVVLALIILTLAVLGFQWRWRQLCQLQLRLDRCVAHATYFARKQLNLIESENQQIKLLRIAIAAAQAAESPSAAALQATLIALSLQVDLQLAHWQAQRLLWAAAQGCSLPGDLPWPMSHAPWTRDVPDSIGPRPLVSTSLSPGIRIQIQHPPRASAAEIKGSPIANPPWQMRWCQPEILGAGTP